MTEIQSFSLSRVRLGTIVTISLVVFIQCTTKKNNPTQAIQIPAEDSSRKIEEVLTLTQNNCDYFLVKLIAQTISEQFSYIDTNALMRESGLAYFTMKSDSTVVYNSYAPGAGDGFFLGSFLQDYLISENGILFKYRGNRLKYKSQQIPQDTGLTIAVLIPWNKLDFCRK